MTAHTPGPWAFDPKLQWVHAQRAHVAETVGTANGPLIAAAPDALEFAQFYDAYMSEQFPEGLQPSYDRGVLHPKAAEAWGRCKSFIAKATGSQSGTAGNASAMKELPGSPNATKGEA